MKIREPSGGLGIREKVAGLSLSGGGEVSNSANIYTASL